MNHRFFVKIRIVSILLHSTIVDVHSNTNQMILSKLKYNFFLVLDESRESQKGQPELSSVQFLFQ